MLPLGFGKNFIIVTLCCLARASNDTVEPDLNSDRVVLKNSIAYHFIRHVRNVETNVLITRRISISPLVIGIQHLAETKDKLQVFCDDLIVNLKTAYGGFLRRMPVRTKRTANDKKQLPVQIRSNVTSLDPDLTMAVDPSVQLLQDTCNSIALHVYEIEFRARERLSKVLNLIDVSLSYNITETINRPRKDKRTKRSVMSFLLKSGLRSIWSLFGIVEGIRNRRRLNRLEKEVAQLQLKQERNSEMVDKLTLVITNHSILLDQLQVTTSRLTQQVNDLAGRVNSLDRKFLFLSSMFQASSILNMLRSVVDRTRDAMDHGFLILEHIVDKSLTSETSAHLLPADQIRKVQVEVSILSNAIIDPEYQRMKSVIVSDPDNPEYLRAIVNVAALSRKHYELVELVPVPLFKGNQVIQPSLSHKAAILNNEEGLFIPLDPREMNNCIKNEHCLTTGPELRTNTLSCGIPQFFDWQKDKCDFESVLSNGIFLKRLGADGIIFSVREEVSAQLFCSAIPSHMRTLTNSGVLQMPAGCNLVITTANGDVTRIRSPPDTQMIEAQDLILISAGPDHLSHIKSLDSLGNTSTILSKAINEHLISIEKQIDSTNHDVSYHWVIVMVLSIILGFTCLFVVILILLLYRYSSRFRRKVKIVRTELQGVGEKIVAFEKEAAAKARRYENPKSKNPNSIESIIRKLDKLEKSAKINEYLNLGSNSSIDKDEMRDLERYGFTEQLDQNRPMPKPRTLYPNVPPRSEIYSIADEYLQHRKAERLSTLDLKSVAPN